MKKLFLLFLTCLSITVHAQHLKSAIDYRFAIHYNPFSLLQVDYTFLPGVEFRAGPKTSIVTEAGYIFSSDYLGSAAQKGRRASGFIIRPSARFYLNDRNSFYLQPQVFYKLVTHRLYDWLGKDCVNEVPAFEELTDFRYRREIYGFNTTAGILVPLSKSANSYLDFYFGLGIRHKSVRIVNEPRSCYDRRGIFFGNGNNDEGTYPSVPLGIKLVFVLK
jgi:hypothetical protein